MIEKEIQFESINPIELYGVNNSKLELIRGHFPKLRIVARDNMLKAMGSTLDLEYFESQIELVIEHLQKHGRISESDLRELLQITYQPEAFNELIPDDSKQFTLMYGNNGKPIRARTATQRKLVSESNKNDLVFAVGPAGSGKTYTAVALAVKALKNKEVRKIVLCRPAVEAEEKLGFLPGDLRDKLSPYLQPLYDALQDMIHPRKLQEMLNDNIIEIAPLAYMRGRTLDNAFVILDEAQNATLNQLKLFLTRMGESAKFIITGDVTQIDLPDKSKSGLMRSIELVKNIEGISVLYFEHRDIVRHRLVKDVVSAFEKYQLQQDAKKHHFAKEHLAETATIEKTDSESN